MTVFVGVISQKGGVGKSTLSRLLAREYAYSKWDVKIAGIYLKERAMTGRKEER